MIEYQEVLAAHPELLQRIVSMVEPCYPMTVKLLAIRFADLQAKPVANQENAHPINDW